MSDLLDANLVETADPDGVTRAVGATRQLIELISGELNVSRLEVNIGKPSA